MEHKYNWQSIYFKDKYVRPESSFKELFAHLIEDEKLFAATRIYESFFRGKFHKTDFAFVGRVSHYSEDLAQLEKIMQIRLPEYRIGTKPDKSQDNIDIEYYRKKLKSEYDLLKDWI